MSIDVKKEKKKIIDTIKKIIDSIEETKLKFLFCNDDKKSDERKIGCNQFRQIASFCACAECYEEIKLMMEYTIAKAKADMSWKKNCGKKKFSDLILDKMNDLYEEYKDEDILKVLELFFGYFYWESRIIADKYTEKKDNYGSSNGKNQFNNRNYGSAGHFNNKKK